MLGYLSSDTGNLIVTDPSFGRHLLGLKQPSGLTCQFHRAKQGQYRAEQFKNNLTILHDSLKSSTLKVWEHRTDFKEELLADADVTAALSPAEIEEKFDLGYHTKHVDTIFARVFGE